MTDLAEKLKAAGADTVGAKFTTCCINALRKCPGNVSAAWTEVGEAFGYEFLLVLIADMTFRSVPKEAKASAPAPVVASIVPRAPLPRERIERRQRLQDVVRSRFKNSAGVAWSDVGWHELPALARDGKEAAALLRAGPANVPNDGRSVGQVLGVKRADAIIEAARETA